MAAAVAFRQLQDYLNTQVLGQPSLVEHLLIAILADGHLLVEGPPGLAKTRAVQALAKGIEGNFHRIQFTPDLLPADLTGTDIYRPETGEFVFQQGPLFHNLVLADEINRAPAKVQSALLEAMAERQITVGRSTYPLPALYTVMATQNPIEQEGTYPLPEAQLDRFLLHLSLGYPDAATEQEILTLTRSERLEGESSMDNPVSQASILSARKDLLRLHMDPAVEAYLVALIMATRHPADYDEELAHWISIGASPRATIALDRCARAKAWLMSRDYVTPGDVSALLHNVLRHRLILSYEAEADGIQKDQVIDRILQCVPAP
ncbi:MoxR family ATPase [Aliidiomarina halalkaliphila]|uniref:MoxR family ATPase n=1 Tax=Aliidiomarina halalkaliphila TaxID=2593535 RepID=A0A552X2W2_9GAMM|nr:MoxR family ATPase [Aliidiomarina halalkaliphila]TRW49371.1 MoxR family ATPase [Aliidiomarina halalkaliphila]